MRIVSMDTEMIRAQRADLARYTSQVRDLPQLWPQRMHLLMTYSSARFPREQVSLSLVTHLPICNIRHVVQATSPAISPYPSC